MSKPIIMEIVSTSSNNTCIKGWGVQNICNNGAGGN